jgi:hypothetical protein
VLIAHAERFSSTSVRWAKSCRSLYKFERLESSHLDNFFGNMNGLSYKVRRRVTNLNAALVLGLGLWVRVVQHKKTVPPTVDTIQIHKHYLNFEFGATTKLRPFLFIGGHQTAHCVS